jgi:hypothetical protein
MVSSVHVFWDNKSFTLKKGSDGELLINDNFPARKLGDVHLEHYEKLWELANHLEDLGVLIPEQKGNPRR